MPRINLSTRRSESNPIDLQPDTELTIPPKPTGGPGINYAEIRAYTANIGTDKIDFFSFDELQPNDNKIALWMTLPYFFEEAKYLIDGTIGSKVNGLHGVFVVNEPPALIAGKHCHHVGFNGCPPQLLTGATHGFTFLHNRFYPLHMIDNTVAWFVCDIDSDMDQDWQANLNQGSKMQMLVAVIAPIVYDATLELYITRNAEIYTPRPSAP